MTFVPVVGIFIFWGYVIAMMAVDFLSEAKLLFPSYAEFIHSDTLLYSLPGPGVGCPRSTPCVATVVLMGLIALLALMGVFATVVLVSLQFHRHIASSQYWHATCSWHSVVCQCSFFLRCTFILFWVWVPCTLERGPGLQAVGFRKGQVGEAILHLLTSYCILQVSIHVKPISFFFF